MIFAATTSILWILLREGSQYPLGLEPMFPALFAAAVCLLVDLMLQRAASP
jgi:hypothetical protein